MLAISDLTSAPTTLQQHSTCTLEPPHKTDRVLQYHQREIAFSYQPQSVRVDVMLRHRYAEIGTSSYTLTDASGDPSSGAKGKQPLREDEEVSSETNYVSPSYNGTIILTPTNRQHQLILSLSLPPKISFRTTIPSTSQIFKIADTLDEIREILDSRTESWNVCDEKGISLFHVCFLYHIYDEILIIYSTLRQLLIFPLADTCLTSWRIWTPWSLD